MAEYMHLIGAEQVQSAAGTIRDAAERISTAAGSMHDSIMRGLERADELVTRMEALAELERTRAVVEKAEARNRLLLDFALYITNHCPCRGMGYWFAGCRLCGDSTFDHECVYQRMECETKACEAARETLAAHKEEAVRAMRAQAKEETRE